MTAARFAPGMFTPDPGPNRWPAMLSAQSRMELTLLLRNGEQLLLTMIIPVALLLGLCLLPIPGLGEHAVDRVVPGVTMVAVMGTAFTGQAIAVGFDRRYGALKRLGATALPRWAVIAGKSIAVLIVVALQALLLGTIGIALGWRPSPAGVVLGALIIGLGTVSFATMGLLLGGTLKAEVVLALANLAWFGLLAVGSFALAGAPETVRTIARLLPSGALGNALYEATQVRVDGFGIAVLAGWALVCGWAAVRWFKFDG
ncbi:ABC transporter permease [Skermania piniformis]